MAIVLVGYDGGWESEGADRPHMDLPGDQDELICAVAAANPRTIVVLNAGAPVAMPWIDEVAAIVQLWFPDMEDGNALADVLFGDVNPSGRLPTTFPRRLEDCPAYPYYPGENGVVRYAEGLLVGCRHYDRAGIGPRFCFGHGLSYTRFAYANLVVSPQGTGAQLSVEVTNVGDRAGQEAVHMYVRNPASAEDRPDRELRAFARLELEPGQLRTVTFDLPSRLRTLGCAAKHVDRQAKRARGFVGSSSRDTRQAARVILSGA